MHLVMAAYRARPLNFPQRGQTVTVSPTSSEFRISPTCRRGEANRPHTEAYGLDGHPAAEQEHPGREYHNGGDATGNA